MKDFINDRIEEICSYEKLSAEEVIYFLVSFFTICFIAGFFSTEIVFQANKLAQPICFVGMWQDLRLELVLFTEIFT